MYTDKITDHVSNPYLWISTVLAASVEKFLFSDWDYLAWLAIAMVCDFITGVTKAWYKREAVTSKGFRDTVAKAVQYGVFLVITHVLINFSTVGKRLPELQLIGELSYTFLILIEIKSVYENIVAINSKFDFLKGIISKIQEYIDRK